MTFSEKIKTRRKELGMTTEDVARIVGVSNATISRWETGAIENPRKDKLRLLAKALELTPAELMDWDYVGDGLWLTDDPDKILPDDHSGQIYHDGIWADSSIDPSVIEHTKQQTDAAIESYNKESCMRLISHSLDALNQEGKIEAVERVYELTQISRYAKGEGKS